ncbi:MAG: GNAT family N-acetyltransferase [Pseudomonadota bacterium]
MDKTEEPSGENEERKFSLRSARDADLPAILQVLETANMHHIPSEEMAELDLHCCFVAEAEGDIIGMSGYKVLTEAEAKTTVMAVLPEYRGWGVGRALQVRRMLALQEKNIRFLTTNADRPEVIAWYKKHFGYQEIGKLDKIHEFGRPDINQWTTLRTDLSLWHE